MIDYNEEDLVGINMYVPKELRKKFKTLCSLESTSMSETVRDLITNWCNEKEQKYQVITLGEN